jgi:hypothetical protein
MSADRNIPAVLLTRDAFRETCLERDNHRCVICGSSADLSVHHILNRSLWSDGGYYRDNGVTLCNGGTPADLKAGRDVGCHLKAEATLISCEQLREAAGISEPLVSAQFTPDERLDTWGNTVLEDGSIAPGELFDTEQCQTMLDAAGLLGRVQRKFRYPRTFHHPLSPGAGSDDSYIESMDAFHGQEVVVTAKLDGENFTASREFSHARSLDSGYHPTRTRATALWNQFRWDIPDGWRVCAENMQGTHSIRYENLPSPLMVFNVWDETNTALSWDETQEWAELLGLPTVPVVYRGVYDEDAVMAVREQPTPWSETAEGIVIRLARPIAYRDWRRQAVKWVRAGHVQTGDEHWMHRSDIPQNTFS